MKALDFLRNKQLDDGSFAGFTSSDKSFTNARRQPTIFPTALIAECLAYVPEAADIRSRAIDFLLEQVNPQGSWNYWRQDTPARIHEPYPDDLDDTACVLAAAAHDARVDSRQLGKFAKLLTAVEQQVGGPYNTWLAHEKQWQQVDIAVNANIAYALRLQKVAPAGLAQYIDRQIAEGQLTSAYYVGEVPVLYFLSRVCSESSKELLKASVSRLITSPPADILGRALLVSAACNIDIAADQLAALANQLRVAKEWPATAFYIDPVYDGLQHYGGSSALTAAFTLEALTKYDHVNHGTVASMATVELSPAVRLDIASLPSEPMRREYRTALKRVRKSAAGGQIMMAGSLVAHAGSWDVSTQCLHHLDTASTHGWVAFTLYDDILDGVAPVRQLATANSAQRRSLKHFMKAGSSQPDFLEYVTEVFDRMDAANDWEMRHARVPVEASELRIAELPDYGDYSQLAEKSLGHSLAACGVAAIHYGDMQHAQVQAFQKFFRHFLIARQLNDDAHDWEKDLQNGQLNSVVTLLLGNRQLPCTINVAADIGGLRLQFWQETLNETSTLIHRHVAFARQSLLDFESFVNISVFTEWLQELESSAQAAERGRNEALEFIQAYEENHV